MSDQSRLQQARDHLEAEKAKMAPILADIQRLEAEHEAAHQSGALPSVLADLAELHRRAQVRQAQQKDLIKIAEKRVMDVIRRAREVEYLLNRERATIEAARQDLTKAQHLYEHAQMFGRPKITELEGEFRALMGDEELPRPHKSSLEQSLEVAQRMAADQRQRGG